MLGFLFGKNKVKNVSAAEVKDKLKEQPIQIIDVRTKREYKQGHIPKALNIPVNKINDNLDKISQDKEIITVCASGMRSKREDKKLSKAG